jgi:hypothetical protein
MFSLPHASGQTMADKDMATDFFLLLYLRLQAFSVSTIATLPPLK